MDMVLGQAAFLHQLFSWAPSHAPPELKISGSTVHNLTRQGHTSACKTGPCERTFARAPGKLRYEASHEHSGGRLAGRLHLSSGILCLTPKGAFPPGRLLSGLSFLPLLLWRPNGSQEHPDGVNQYKWAALARLHELDQGSMWWWLASL